MTTNEGRPLIDVLAEDEPELAVNFDEVAKDTNPEQTMVGRYEPPSTTVVRTKTDGWYYVPITFEEVLDLLQDAAQTSADLLIFDVVGNEATKVAIRPEEITAIVDLTPYPEPTE